ncbi:aspartate carbamoyltransferase [Candidatus Woesearchaeota archaeon]|nr:aspartate carbamoyltransferase [Candidatus Woesearchaeota archaeon]
MFFTKKNPLKWRDIISINDLSKDDIIYLLQQAAKLERYNPRIITDKVIASLFFEPSTRTRLSFDAAVKRLGGQVIGFDNIETTSLKKGESFKDTIKMIEQYADVIVIRHPKEGSAQLAADISHIPVINAGDGSNQHPTQTLVDLYTIKKEKGKLEGLTVGFLGDLKFGRTVHSLANALGLFGVNIVFIAPKGLEMPTEYLKELNEKNVNYSQTSDLLSVAQSLDVLYVTRIQEERFKNRKDYKRVAGSYTINKDLLANFRQDVLVMHPLPRLEEINQDVDDTQNQGYFKQAGNAVAVRKAILATVLGRV